MRQFLESDAAGIVAVDRSEKLADELAALKIKFGAKLVCVRGDVTVEATAIEFTRAAIEHFGRIDVLINNAGVGSVTRIHETTPEEWDRVMNVNIKSAFWSARHVIPEMLKAGHGGTILNTGSISGVAGITGQGVYGPSKGAIHQPHAANGDRIRAEQYSRQYRWMRNR